MERTIKIEGILTDETYEWLKEVFIKDEFYTENPIDFLRVNAFSGNANITLVSIEKLLGEVSVDDLPVGTLVIENEDDDNYKPIDLGSISDALYEKCTLSTMPMLDIPCIMKLHL